MPLEALKRLLPGLGWIDTQRSDIFGTHAGIETS